MPRDANGLTPRQALFVAEYLKDLNATEAAKRAGYSGRNVHQILSNSAIAAQIKAKTAAVLGKYDVTKERVMQEVARLAFSTPKSLYDATGKLIHVKDLDDDAAAAVHSPETRTVNLKAGDGVTDEIVAIKTWDKPKALEQLMKHLGLLEEKVNVSGNVSFGWLK